MGNKMTDEEAIQIAAWLRGSAGAGAGPVKAKKMLAMADKLHSITDRSMIEHAEAAGAVLARQWVYTSQGSFTGIQSYEPAGLLLGRDFYKWPENPVEVPRDWNLVRARVIAADESRWDVLDPDKQNPSIVESPWQNSCLVVARPSEP